MSKTEHFDKIWSRAASQKYRSGVDRMLCNVAGCKRWKRGGGLNCCEDHAKFETYTKPAKTRGREDWE